MGSARPIWGMRTHKGWTFLASASGYCVQCDSYFKDQAAFVRGATGTGDSIYVEQRHLRNDEMLPAGWSDCDGAAYGMPVSSVCVMRSAT